MRNQSGFTLIELLIVIAIIVTLVAVAGIYDVMTGGRFVGWRGRAAVETEMRTLYNNLMNARVNAMNRNRNIFVMGTADYYAFFEDTSPWPNGDGVLQTAADQPIPELSAKNRLKAPALAFLADVPDKIEYAYCLQAGYALPLIIDKNGLLSFTAALPTFGTIGASIRIDPDKDCNDGIHDKEVPPLMFKKNADYDCINIQGTRIKMGKWNVATNACDIK